MRTKYLLAALPLTCLFAGNAFAQACTKPLALSNELQMVSRGGGPSSIPVKINGTDQQLILATAGTTTQVNEDFAKSLNLEIKRADDVLLMNERGETSRDQVTIADFSMGRLHGTNVKWPVSIGGGGFGGGDDGGGAAKGRGLFSLNYMRLYDVDADFGSDRLRLFNQDHCPGAVMYWKATGLAGVVPITIDKGRVTVPVTVDGKVVRGVIDTAAPGSKVYTAIANRVLGVDTTGARSITAKTVAIGQLNLSDVKFAVTPDINSGQGKDPAEQQRIRKAALEYELANPDVVIGMDVLRKLHIYLAFGENKLYVTQSETPAPAAEAAKTP